MMVCQYFLVLLTLISAVTCILFDYNEPRRLFYIFKPLTIVLILLLPLLSVRDQTLYRGLITAGLICSLAGDILFMLPTDRFLEGVIAFGIAHLCYIAAYVSEISTLAWLPLIPLILVGILYLFAISPALGNYKVPVYFYMAVITFMIWMAWERWIQDNDSRTLAALIGAGLFALSDSVLIVERFKSPFRLSRAAVLGTYFTAQLLIAWSAVL